MRTILFLLAIMLSSFVNAQKIEMNEVDPFTGDRKMETTFFSNITYGLKFGSINNVPYLQWNSQDFYFIVNPGMKFTMLDDNNNKYEFTCFYSNGMNYFRYWGDFNKIIGKNIVKYRMQLRNEYFDQEFKAKKQKKISDYYLCLKSEIEKHYDSVANMDEITKALSGSKKDSNK